MNAPAISFSWDGEVFRPRYPKIVDRHYVIGESYMLAPYEQRSQASHNHYFASVHEGWQSMPEDQSERFPTPVHLRKWCLIKAGYHDERSIVAGSKAEALRLASFVKPMDDFAVVTVSGDVVTVYTAKSQSMKAMGADVFKASKDAVLGEISAMVGVRPADLRANAGRAA